MQKTRLLWSSFGSRPFFQHLPFHGVQALDQGFNGSLIVALEDRGRVPELRQILEQQQLQHQVRYLLIHR